MHILLLYYIKYNCFPTFDCFPKSRICSIPREKTFFKNFKVFLLQIAFKCYFMLSEFTNHVVNNKTQRKLKTTVGIKGKNGDMA